AAVLCSRPRFSCTPSCLLCSLASVTATTALNTLSLHDALPISHELVRDLFVFSVFTGLAYSDVKDLTADRLQTFFDGNLWIITRSEEHTSELQSRFDVVWRLLLDQKKNFPSTEPFALTNRLYGI